MSGNDYIPLELVFPMTSHTLKTKFFEVTCNKRPYPVARYYIFRINSKEESFNKKKQRIFLHIL